MGWREAAYLKYLKGEGGTLDSVPPEDLPYLQEMAARAYMKQGANQGQLLYANYAFSPDEKIMDIARVIGKTAPGNITREGNNWRVKDVYDFYSEGWDKDLERSKKLLMSGDPIGALSAMSPHVARTYNGFHSINFPSEWGVQMQKLKKAPTLHFHSINFPSEWGVKSNTLRQSMPSPVLRLSSS